MATAGYLFDEHRRELVEQSAIAPDVVAERGYRSVGRPHNGDQRPREELVRLGIPSWATSEDRLFPGLLIPMYRATGERVSYQWKPRTAVPNRDGRAMRYASVKGRASVLDVHPRWSTDRGRDDPALVPCIRDTNTPLWITEGVKKADALTSHGCCTVALSGVFSWRATLGTLGDWEDIPLRGRTVFICFDADARTNSNVLRAMQRFGRWLRSKGATPYYLVVPDQVPLATATSGADVKGVDDYLAAGGTVAQLMAAATTEPPQADQHGQDTFTDSRMAELVAENVLTDRFVWVRQFGWMTYDGRVWAECSDACVGEAVRAFLIERFSEVVTAFAATKSTDTGILDAWRSLLSAARQGSVIKLCRGLVEHRPEDFDTDRDLLNTPSGVVDLRTGDVEPPDPSRMLTKITQVGYSPGATHPDWDKALQAIPYDCRSWLQVRMGQATTGHMTPDDVLLVQQGKGENGKTTVMAAITGVLGGYATAVSQRALLADANTHPTELMDLFGARLATLEETPEAGRLSVTRLKQTVGTTPMKARQMHRDPVQWDPTHTLVLNTNYRPTVDETDHGTWRRLMLLDYPYTFRKRVEDVTSPSDRLGDPGLRERVRHDPAVRVAVLAWLVDGARSWYAAGRVMPHPPARVVADTLAWRATADRILGFWVDRLVADQAACVLAEEMLEAFNAWLAENGHHRWARETFVPRFAGHDLTGRHGVERRRTRHPEGVDRWSGGSLVGLRPLRSQEMVWVGVRFRTASDQCGCGFCASCAEASANSLTRGSIGDLPEALHGLHRAIDQDPPIINGYQLLADSENEVSETVNEDQKVGEGHISIDDHAPIPGTGCLICQQPLSPLLAPRWHALRLHPRCLPRTTP